MEVLFIAGLALSASMAWAIGGNDTANSVDSIVGAGVLDVRKAIALFAVGQFVGAVAQGYMVMKTIGKGIVQNISVIEAIVAIIAAFIWITIATLMRAPISTTHSIVGAVIGIGIVRALSGASFSLDVGVVVKIVLSWVVSPLTAMALAIPMYIVFKKIFDRYGLNDKAAKLILIATMLFSAYSFGANDVGNATGIYVSVTCTYLGLPDEVTMRFLSLMASAFIALGGFTIGKRVVETLAFRVTRLDIPMALAAEVANALCVWLFTTIPFILFGFGLPISTTYATAGSIIGAGIAKYRGFSGVNMKTVIFIVCAWVLTLPLTASASIAIYLLFNAFLSGRI